MICHLHKQLLAARNRDKEGYLEQRLADRNAALEPDAVVRVSIAVCVAGEPLPDQPSHCKTHKLMYHNRSFCTFPIIYSGMSSLGGVRARPLLSARQCPRSASEVKKMQHHFMI